MLFYCSIETKKCHYCKKYLFNKSKHFILYTILFNTCECLIYHQLQLTCNQHNQLCNQHKETIKYSFFFILAEEKSSTMFPRHNRFATISKSFALNLIISVPLTNK